MDNASTPVEPAIANPERGEDELILAGVTYLLRPSRQAIRAIESKTGLPLLTLVRTGNVGELTTDQLGEVACQLIRAGATDELTRRVDAGRLSDLIYEDGIVGTMLRVTAVLADAASGGRTASGEPKATTA